jgi:hypothetical protein
MARTPVPLTQLDRRPPEAGRIRMGEKTDRAMRSLDRFRFTSPDQTLIQAIAALYGGTVRPWNEPKAKVKQQWQVTITASEIDVYMPQDGLSIWYEMWAGGGCQRRCDGVECQVPMETGPGQHELVMTPCICDARQLMECKPYTRLSVIIPNIPFAGVWRLESKGWNAAHELPGMADLISTLQGSGQMVQATLGVERRDEMVMGKKQSFVVPKLAIKQTVLELQTGAADAAALALNGSPVAALGSGETSTAAGFDVLAKERQWGELVPSNADGIEDAEVVDDELLELEARLRADGRQFGLDPERYLRAVKAQCQGDRERMRDCSAQVRAEQLVPLSFTGDGSIQWGRPK